MTQPFYFPDGRVANDAKDLLELCEQYPDDATGFLIRQDLEKWLAYIGSYDAAECAANARQIDTDDRQKLEDFLNRCHSLTAAKPVPEAVTATETEENIAAPESAESAEAISEASPAIVTEAPLQEVAIEPEKAKSEATKTPKAIATSPAEPAIPEATKPSPQPAAKAEIPSADTPAEKPSFFQVVAGFFVKIFYRDKA